MNTRQALTLALPLMLVFSGAASARIQVKADDSSGQSREHRAHPGSSRQFDRGKLRVAAGDPRRSDTRVEAPDRQRERHPERERDPGERPGSRRDPHWGDDRRPPRQRPGDDWHGGDRDGDRWHHDGDRWDRDGDRWHRERYERDGHIYWRFDIRLFPRYDFGLWQRGRWHHGWHGDRWGWWWLAGGIWYYYPVPIYPYPDPYVPGSVVVVNNTAASPQPPAEQPVQYWYHCSSPEGYYPYVANCPAGWQPVPATPPVAGSGAPPPQAQAQQPSPAPATPPRYWYYCQSPAGYYPYVPSCPGGWTRVPATPSTGGGATPPGAGSGEVQ